MQTTTDSLGLFYLHLWVKRYHHSHPIVGFVSAVSTITLEEEKEYL